MPVKLDPNAESDKANVSATEELADGDWYYQIHSHLEFTPKAGEKISCMVEHASLREPLQIVWALGAMASDCGRALGLLAHARRQVWLAQSSLPEACRNNLRELPLTPGHLFGPAAQEALERRVRVTESRSQHAAQRSGFDDPRVSICPNRQASAQPVPARSPNRFFRGQHARPTHLAYRGSSNQCSRPWPAWQPPRQRPPKANEPASRRR
ncbi:hypothetical protein ACEWY4_009613 [Coilia grayii]|uniref:Immunoglobulin C1-set domain-containing protein n=1 Tax=Coilia grayii TaxID=363190 RepID=A0ABD1K706_9TELE